MAAQPRAGVRHAGDVLGLKLVAWNMRGGAARKLGALHAFGADVLVLSEVESEVVNLLGGNGCWTGSVGKRGVAVVGLGAWTVERLAIDLGSSIYLPTVVSNGDVSVLLVGCCVQKGTKPSYAASAAAALDALKSFVSQRASVFAGDFNMHGVGGGAKRSQAFFDKVASLGYKSVWHSDRAEALGAESRPTFRNHRGSFHIDYVFASPAVGWTSIDIGLLDDYGHLSDHAPLFARLLIGKAPADHGIGGPGIGSDRGSAVAPALSTAPGAPEAV